MKRTVAFLISVIIIFSFGISAHAYDPSYQGIDFNIYSAVYYPRVKQGNVLYHMERPLDNVPRTVEAWVYLTKGTDKAGVLLSNKNDGGGAYISIETDSRGALTYTNSGHSAIFESAVIPKEQWTHIAIVNDEQKGTVSCYLDGQLQDSESGFGKTDKKALTCPFTVGGDSEYQNYPPFRGRVKELYIFSSVKRKTEIAYDSRHSIDPKNEDVIAAYIMSADRQGKNISDNSTNANDLIYSATWLTESDMQKYRGSIDRAYSFAVVGDTQYMSEFYPSALNDMYRWIASNREKYNIKCVLGLGDMTNRDTQYEWENVKAAISAIDGIPHLAVRGNHDIKDYTAIANNAYHLSQSGKDTDIGDSTGGLGFEQLFSGAERGGVYNGSITNSWQIVENKWLILCLDYLPSTDVLNWASDVVSDHADKKVIVTTHAYLNRNGERLDYAEYIWDDFVSRHKNIALVLSGHINSARIVTSVEGNVTQMLVDSQSCDNRFRGAGFIAMLYFNEDGSECEVEYISTSSESKGLYYRGINRFKIEI